MTAQPKMDTLTGLTFTKRRAQERGKADFGWLKSAHSFSFGRYYDPNHTGFGNLIVINDDLVDGGHGFGEHPHRNAEIFSYVVDGALEHKDSMGNGSVVCAGGVQFMSAGSGVTHSEFNPSQNKQMRFLQVWLVPERQNTNPYYDTLDIRSEDKDGKLKLFLSQDGRNGSMKTKADADVYAATLHDQQRITHYLPQGRKAWVQIAKGSLQVNQINVQQGDGLAIDGSGALVFDKAENAEFLFFELAP